MDSSLFVCLQETQESLFELRASTTLYTGKKGRQRSAAPGHILNCTFCAVRHARMVHSLVYESANSTSSHFRTADEVSNWNRGMQH